MADLRILQDVITGEQFFPYTHESAVVDKDGRPALEILKSDLSKEIAEVEKSIYYEETARTEAVEAEKNRAISRENEIEALFTAPTEEAVSKWLDEHPEATTTVQDGSLEVAKFTENAKLHLLKDYVTPEMFGAVGDGVTDDSDSFRSMSEYAYETKVEIKLLNKKYYVTGSHIFGAPKSFVETDYDRLTYNLNIDGGESIILWKPLTDTDYFLYGQHLRHSNIKNLKIKVVSDAILGSFLATNTNNNNNESHTFSCNLFENIVVNGNLRNFILFDCTGDKGTHDDLSTFINCTATCLNFYATNNGNSVNLVFTNCNYSSYGLDTEESGSFVKIYTESWGGGLTFYGCHITTKSNDIVISTKLGSKRRIALHDCRAEVYGDNVQLVNSTGGIIKITNFECVPLTDDLDHDYFVLSSLAQLHATHSTFVGTKINVSSYASFIHCQFYYGRTIDTLRESIVNTNETAYPYTLHIETTAPNIIYDYKSLLEKKIELRAFINGNYTVNRNTVYTIPAPITATFEYKYNNLSNAYENATYALYVNGTLKQRVSLSEKINNIVLEANDTVNFKFYTDAESTSDVAEPALGITSSAMFMTYTCN